MRRMAPTDAGRNASCVARAHDAVAWGPALTTSRFGASRKPKVKAAPGLRWEDEARFIRTWLESPKTTGAVSPSGRSLSRTMARRVDPSIAGPIIELGPGTGPVTDALIRRGVAPERLVLIEFDGAFCKLLARRYPGCTIVQGDAYALARTLRHVNLPPAAAVVSSLPLLNRPDHQRFELLLDALDMMVPGAPFVQFTYGLVSPIPRQCIADAPIEAHATAPVWLNLPPARVWTYRLGEGSRSRVQPVDFIDRLKIGGGKARRGMARTARPIARRVSRPLRRGQGRMEGARAEGEARPLPPRRRPGDPRPARRAGGNPGRQAAALVALDRRYRGSAPTA